MTDLSPIATAPVRVKLRIQDYLLLDEAGALAGYPRTELVDGEILCMNAQFRPHMVVKNVLAFALHEALKTLGSTLFVGTEASVLLGDHDMPEPDIVLTNDPHGEGPVLLASVALVVEVADATLERDLTTKAALYARAGIPEYWVADVAGRAIRQMWLPRDGAYAETRSHQFGDRITAVTIDGLEVETAALR